MSNKTPAKKPADEYHTPPELAKRLRRKPESIRKLIEAGELKATNMASPGSKRPRYIVSDTDLAIFLSRRSVRATPAPPPTRRRKREEGITEFY